MTAPGAFYSGSIPPNMQHPGNFEKTALPSAFADSSPLMPVGLSASPYGNAAISNVIQTTKAKTTPSVPIFTQMFEVNGQDLGFIKYINGFAI
jgi:hypothetical protein